MLAETPVRTRGSDEIPERTEHRSRSIAGFALEISFWIARACRPYVFSHIEGYLVTALAKTQLTPIVRAMFSNPYVVLLTIAFAIAFAWIFERLWRVFTPQSEATNHELHRRTRV
jgi:hypothetical protein